MRDVLIDDADALVVDRDDEGVAELAQGIIGRTADRCARGAPGRRRVHAVLGRSRCGAREARTGALSAPGATWRRPAAGEDFRRRGRQGSMACIGRPGIRSDGRSCSSGAGPLPSASPTARRTTSWTSDCSRKRTSALVGCTLTSTRSGGISRNRCTSGLRSRFEATL